MEYLLPIALTIAAVAVIGLTLVWRPLRRFGRQINVERARESFRLQREGLRAKFIEAAQATGKPRGLSWKDCQFDSAVEFVRDKKTGDIAALVGMTVAFEAVAGSDMEDNPNVDKLRNASAVFFFHKGHWNTAGRAVFNMNPPEAIEHFKNQYDRISN
jgi:hypothetical protein